MNSTYSLILFLFFFHIRINVHTTRQSNDELHNHCYVTIEVAEQFYLEVEFCRKCLRKNQSTSKIFFCIQFAANVKRYKKSSVPFIYGIPRDCEVCGQHGHRNCTRHQLIIRRSTCVIRWAAFHNSRYTIWVFGFWPRYVGVRRKRYSIAELMWTVNFPCFANCLKSIVLGVTTPLVTQWWSTADWCV